MSEELYCPRFKCKYLDQIRLVYIAKPIKYDSLREQISQLFQIEPMLSCKVQGGQRLAVTSQQALDQAVAAHESRDGPGGLKITLEVKELAGHSSVNGTLQRPLQVSKGGSSRKESRRARIHDTARTELTVPAERSPSPPPGHYSEFERGKGHARSNSGSFAGHGQGGLFIPEAGGRLTGKYSDGRGSVRSTSSASSNHSTHSSGSGSGSSRFRVRSEDGGDGGGRTRSGTFPRPGVSSDDGVLAGFSSMSLGSGGGGGAAAAGGGGGGGHAAVDQWNPGRWKRGKLLGSGAFGQVYLALNLDTGAEFAVKQVELHTDIRPESLKECKALETEITILKRLEHERIVKYYGTHRTSDYLAIFMEYVAGRSVHVRLREYGAFREEVVRKYTRQVLEGLVYLHSNRIVHRDIKGANVLADASGNVKLADFGASKQMKSVKTLMGFKSVHGTPYWMSPEAITTGASVGPPSDIWSTAALVIEMCTTQPPFGDVEPMAALFKIGQVDTDFTKVIPTGVSAMCRAYLTSSLQRLPEKRPTAKELLRDPFVSR